MSYTRRPPLTRSTLYFVEMALCTLASDLLMLEYLKYYSFRKFGGSGGRDTQAKVKEYKAKREDGVSVLAATGPYGGDGGR